MMALSPERLGTTAAEIDAYATRTLTDGEIERTEHREAELPGRIGAAA